MTKRKNTAKAGVEEVRKKLRSSAKKTQSIEREGEQPSSSKTPGGGALLLRIPTRLESSTQSSSLIDTAVNTEDGTTPTTRKGKRRKREPGLNDVDDKVESAASMHVQAAAACASQDEAEEQGTSQGTAPDGNFATPTPPAVAANIPSETLVLGANVRAEVSSVAEPVVSGQPQQLFRNEADGATTEQSSSATAVSNSGSPRNGPVIITGDDESVQTSEVVDLTKEEPVDLTVDDEDEVQITGAIEARRPSRHPAIISLIQRILNTMGVRNMDRRNRYETASDNFSSSSSDNDDNVEEVEMRSGSTRTDNDTVTIVEDHESTETGGSSGTGSAFKCTICLDVKQKLSATKCGHVFCSDCISDVLKSQHKCPHCRRSITRRDVFPIYL
eukprot:Colp12_sorted_trinity150504_noHs@30846